MSNQPNQQDWGPSTAEPNQPSFDLVGMLQRRFWIIILCLIVLTGGGFFWFWKSEVKYTSTARANIFQKDNNISIIGNDGFAASAKINSHDQIIRSETVLYSAADEILKIIREGGTPDTDLEADLGGDRQDEDLLENPESQVYTLTSMQNQNRAQIMTHLLKSIEVTQDRNDKNIYQISYTGSSKSDCHVILGIVLKEYENHLLATYQNENDEILQNIKKARDAISLQMSTLQDDYNAWKREHAEDYAKLKSGIFTTEEGRFNHFRTEAQTLYNELEAKKKKQNELTQDLDWIKSAVESKMTKQEILTHIDKFNEWLGLEKGKLNAQASNTKEALNAPLQFEEPEPSAGLIQARLQVSKLKLDLEDLMDRGFGENHPDVKTTNRLLSGAQLQLTTLEDLHKERVSNAKAKFEELKKHRDAIANNNSDDLPVLPSVLEEIDLIGLHESFLNGELVRVKSDIGTLKENYQAKLVLAEELDVLLSAERRRESDIAEQKKLTDAIISKISEFNIEKENGGYRVDLLNSPSLGKQTEPSALKIFAITTFLGLALGVGFGYLIELADKTFRTPAEIATQLGMQVIGHVPVLSTKKVIAKGSALDETLVAFHLPKSQQSEAFRAIRTSIFFNAQGKNSQIIQVTSPTPGDGKSTLAANLAISLAQSGKRVLIVDADLRRPTVNYLFGSDSEIGFAAVLNGEAEIEDAIMDCEVEGLSVMPAGSRPSNPSELLTSSHLYDLFEVLREKFDFIIMDSPPLLAVTDPSAVAARCDGVILAMRIKKNIKLSASRSKEILDSVDSNVIGVVVNGAGMVQGAYSSGGYGYGYGYDYGNSYYSYGYDYGESSYYYDEENQPTTSNRS